MSYESDFLNFCLSCDKHTTDGPYCSHACRLADLEKSGSPSVYASSPTSSINPAASSWGSASSSSGFYLPPAVDFSALSKSQRSSSSSFTRSREQMSRSSSVSSTASTAEQHQAHTCTMSCMSESARRELRHYESLFDQTRHHRYSSR